MTYYNNVTGDVWHHILGFLKPKDAVSLQQYLLSESVGLLVHDATADEQVFSERFRKQQILMSSYRDVSIFGMNDDLKEYTAALYAGLLFEYFTEHPENLIAMPPRHQKMVFSIIAAPRPYSFTPPYSLGSDQGQGLLFLKSFSLLQLTPGRICCEKYQALFIRSLQSVEASKTFFETDAPASTLKFLSLIPLPSELKPMTPEDVLACQSPLLYTRFSRKYLSKLLGMTNSLNHQARYLVLKWMNLSHYDMLGAYIETFESDLERYYRRRRILKLKRNMPFILFSISSAFSIAFMAAFTGFFVYSALNPKAQLVPDTSPLFRMANAFLTLVCMLCTTSVQKLVKLTGSTLYSCIDNLLGLTELKGFPSFVDSYQNILMFHDFSQSQLEMVTSLGLKTPDQVEPQEARVFSQEWPLRYMPPMSENEL